MRRRFALLVLALLAPARAGAETVQLVSETMLNFFPNPQQRELHLVAPFIEFLRFRADGLRDNTMSVDVAGWGGFDLATSLIPGRAGADFSMGVLHWQDPKTGLSADLGRQYLLLGLGRAEHFDGARFGMKLPPGLALEVFAGEQAGPRLTWQAGDWLAGGRMSGHYKDLLSVGISFLQARQADALARELLGGDLTARPTPWLELGLGALYDTVHERLAQLDVFSTFVVPQVPGLRVLADFRRVVPASILDKTSIFSVFSDAVRTELGGDVSYPLNRSVTLRADVHGLLFFDGGTGYRVGADAVLTFGPAKRTVVTLRLGRWREVTDGYTEYRAAVRHYFMKGLFAAVDGQFYRYDEGALHGEQFSFGSSFVVGYEPRRNLRALLAAEAGITPLFERVVQLLAKLEWNFVRSY